jgi:hypothetical protein
MVSQVAPSPYPIMTRRFPNHLQRRHGDHLGACELGMGRWSDDPAEHSRLFGAAPMTLYQPVLAPTGY